MFPVRVMCDVMGVSSAGYYAWRGRPESSRKAANRALLTEIRRVHTAHRGRYGAPRIHAALRAGGCRASRAIQPGMPPGTTCSPSTDTTIVPPSDISPPYRQSAKPLNPGSTKSGEGQVTAALIALDCLRRPILQRGGVQQSNKLNHARHQDRRCSPAKWTRHYVCRQCGG
jgi:hypothetical protein